MMVSPGATMPRSPWTASAGWRKWAGVPVERRVAAILWAMMPDLPMPVRKMFCVALGCEEMVDGRGEGSEHGGVEAESEVEEGCGFDADEV